MMVFLKWRSGRRLSAKNKTRFAEFIYEVDYNVTEPLIVIDYS